MNLLNHLPSIKSVFVCVASSVTLAGCQTLPVDVDGQLAPLDRALADRPSEIERSAGAGDVEAQLAMAILNGRGIRGYRIDELRAADWRQRALAARHTIPITQYTAAFNGQPSRVNIINLQVSAVTPGQLNAIDSCLDLLAGRRETVANACGSPEATLRRRSAWAREVLAIDSVRFRSGP